MMAMMKTLVGAAVLVTLAASPVLGQGLAGGGFGSAAPGSKLGDETDPSWAINGFGSVPLRGIWNVRASGAFDRFRLAREDRDACKAAGFDCHSRIGRIDGGIEITARESKVRPFGFVEIGAYNFKEEAAALQGTSAVKVSESTTNLGGGFGGGVRAALGPHVGVGTELPLRWWRQKEDGEKETYWYLEPTGFVFVKF
jgi:outer membrane protein with beta-barrel domain